MIVSTFARPSAFSQTSNSVADSSTLPAEPPYRLEIDHRGAVRVAVDRALRAGRAWSASR